MSDVNADIAAARERLKQRFSENVRGQGSLLLAASRRRSGAPRPRGRVQRRRSGARAHAAPLARRAPQTRTGGKGSMRRKKKSTHKTTSNDDKRLQATLKRLGVTTIPAIEEVNIFQNDGNIIHFENPKGARRANLRPDSLAQSLDLASRRAPGRPLFPSHEPPPPRSPGFLRPSSRPQSRQQSPPTPLWSAATRRRSVRAHSDSRPRAPPRTLA